MRRMVLGGPAAGRHGGCQADCLANPVAVQEPSGTNVGSPGGVYWGQKWFGGEECVCVCVRERSAYHFLNLCLALLTLNVRGVTHFLQNPLKCKDESYLGLKFAKPSERKSDQLEDISGP